MTDSRTARQRLGLRQSSAALVLARLHPWSLPVSDPTTLAEVQTVVDKLNELINALQA